MLPLFSALLALLLVFPAAFAHAGGQVNAFIYHRFAESRYPSTNISAETFRQQLSYLRQQNYPVLSAGEIVRRLHSGEALPEQAAAIIVDDAFLSFAEVAMPIIREFGFPVSLFVNTDAVGSRNYLDWEQLRSLQEEGVEIGNHTASHLYLVELEPGEGQADWKERIRTDILRAQRAFQQQLGFAPQLFVYPYGEYSPQVIELVRELGFSAAFAQQSGVITADSDLYTLPRFPMGGPFATLPGFVGKLQMKALQVLRAEPADPVLVTNPPELLLQIDGAGVDLRRANCFVQGENRCQLQPVAGQKGWYRAVAEQPLSGRRNKYTITAPGRKGGWHWYSHLWIQAQNPLPAGTPEVGESAAGAQVDVGEAGQSVTADQ